MSSNQQGYSLEETLSAMVDGEASELELRRALQALDGENGQDLRARWQRYHLASSAIRKDIPSSISMDLSASISAAISEEPAHTGKPQQAKKKSRFLVNVARMGVAACVAGGMVFGLQSLPEDQQNGIQLVDDRIPVNLTVQPVSNQQELISNKKNEVIIDPKHLPGFNDAQYHDVLGRLMLEHAQNASQNTQFGILPYSKFQTTK